MKCQCNKAMNEIGVVVEEKGSWNGSEMEIVHSVSVYTLNEVSVYVSEVKLRQQFEKKS